MFVLSRNFGYVVCYFKKLVRYSLYNGNGQLMTNEGNFEEVAEFKYLGTIITNRNECAQGN